MPATTSNAWRIEMHTSGLATLWFDRPGTSQNSLDGPTLDELSAKIAKIATLPDLIGLIIRSAKSKGFCAGADLKALRACPTEEDVKVLLDKGVDAFERLGRLSIPTLAVVQGTCLGGGLELALACDGIAAIDTPETKLGTPEIKLGLIPGWGAIPELCRRIGPKRAIDMLLSGEPLSAKASLKCKLVDMITTPQTIESDMLRFMKSTRRRKRDPQPIHIESANVPTAIEVSGAAESLVYLIQQELAETKIDVRRESVATLARLVVSPTARAAIDKLFAK